MKREVPTVKLVYTQPVFFGLCSAGFCSFFHKHVVKLVFYLAPKTIII